MSILRSIESWLQQRIEGTSGLSAEAQPLDLVRQIEREIERNKKIFINDETFVPHRLIVHLFAPTSARVEEYEALFNTPSFREWVEAYIAERGYKLLDRLRVTTECHQEPRPEFKGRACWVEFSWPQGGADPADCTVVIDPKDRTRILSAEPGQSEVPIKATLEVISGEAYVSPIVITRRTTNIGRSENVLDHQTRRLLRVNHLAFKRPESAEAVNHTISRRHAHITFADGQFRLFDDGSQNGTRVQRGDSTLMVPKATASAEWVALLGGDVVIVGRARVKVIIEALPTS